MVVKKYLKSILGAFIIIIVSMFLVSVLHYFNIINTFFVNIFKLLVIFISLFFSGFVMGKNASKRGYIAGLQSGLIITFILLMYNLLIARGGFSAKLIIFYIILLAIAIIGGMIGISKSSLTENNK